MVLLTCFFSALSRGKFIVNKRPYHTAKQSRLKIYVKYPKARHKQQPVSKNEEFMYF